MVVGPFENPGATFLALHVAAEEPLDDLAVGADERVRRELREERPGAFSGGVRGERVLVFELEPERAGERTDRVRRTVGAGL